MTARTWLDGKVSTAPTALQQRIRHLADAVIDRGPAAQSLAQLASGTLESVIKGAGDRSAALDLLAADALITLALLAQAEADPAGLGQFSLHVLGAGAAGP